MFLERQTLVHDYSQPLHPFHIFVLFPRRGGCKAKSKGQSRSPEIAKLLGDVKGEQKEKQKRENTGIFGDGGCRTRTTGRDFGGSNGEEEAEAEVGKRATGPSYDIDISDQMRIFSQHLHS